MMHRSAVSALALCCCALAACDATGATRASRDAPAQMVDAPGPQLAAQGVTAPVDRPDLPGFCKTPGADAVRDVFCGPVAPDIRSLQDLQRHLGLVFDERELGPADQPPMVSSSDSYLELSLVLLNTSTALSGRLVSTLNPRAILLGPNATLAFSRGIQQVELISRERDDGAINLYLLSFEQACNAARNGCSPGDLYTPRIESNWTNLRIEDDEQLKNSPSDCRQCHQRGRDKGIFLMRELDGPWTHFFTPDQDEPEGRSPEASGVDVVRAYFRAKGDEPYANVPWRAIRATVGLTLQMVVDRPQPLVFDGDEIMNERWPWTMEQGYAAEPLPSATWYRHYAAFKRGEHLALPHFDPFPSDPAKLARLTEAYQRFRNGELSAEELPDLGDVYPDDAQTLAEIGFQSEPGASPAATLVQACGACHNDVLDQSISRARFNIALQRQSRAALDLAIERLQLPKGAPGRMPPAEARQLDPNALEPLLQYLRQDMRPAEDDALLESAARLGMAEELSGAPSGPLAP
jgi:hypothetical protein